MSRSAVGAEIVNLDEADAIDFNAEEGESILSEKLAGSAKRLVEAGGDGASVKIEKQSQQPEPDRKVSQGPCTPRGGQRSRE